MVVYQAVKAHFENTKLAYRTSFLWCTNWIVYITWNKFSLTCLNLGMYIRHFNRTSSK
jgi:hypothetical protein